MLLPLIPSLLLIAKAAEFFLKKRNPVVLPVISVLFVCVLIPMRVYASIKMGALQRDNYFLIDFGRNVLKHLPPGTLLFSDRADELEFSLAYLLYAEHRRSDVRFIDCNAGVSRSIYGHDYYGIWGKPRLRIREKIEKELIARWKGPVMYGTMDTKQIDVPMTQNGFLYNVPHTVIDQAPVPWDEFLINERGNVNHEKRLQHLFYSSASLLAQYFLDNNMINAGDKKIALLKAYAGWKHWGIMAGYWYYERKMYSKADAEYQSILVKDEDPAVLVYLGSLYNEWQKFDRAEEVLKRSIYLDPAQGQAHYNLAVVYWHKKKWQESAEEFNKTIALEPDNTQAKKFYHKALERYKKK